METRIEWRGVDELRVEFVLVSPAAVKIERAHEEVRQDTGKSLSMVSGSGACYLGRNRRSSPAAEADGELEYEQPRGSRSVVSEAKGGGDAGA